MRGYGALATCFMAFVVLLKKKDSRVGGCEASQVKGRPSNMFVKYHLKSNTAFARLSTIKTKGFGFLLFERLLKCLCAYWPGRQFH